jgi:HK97 family phage prohead protease
MELTRKFLASSSMTTLADQRQVKVVCSTGKPDRSGDVVVQRGIDLDAYRKNPIVLWNHSADVPIASSIEIDVKGDQLQATVQFPPEGEDEDSDWVYGKIKAGIVNATSIGFIPKSYSPLNPKEPWSGYRFDTSELLEFSFVSVPANSGCLIVGRSVYNDVELPLLPSLAKSAPCGAVDESHEFNQDNASVLVPRSVLEEAFRLAKTPRTTRQKYLAKSEVSDWKVGAEKDLPIVDAVWDGPAAAKRMLDDAGFDGDSPDAAKAARGFLLHDAANPLLRSSYTLPFADIVDGELKAIKPGIVAAKSRIDQSDAPEEMRAGAKEISDVYIGLAAFMVASGEKVIIAPMEKSGRKISNANAAKLKEAMDHHESMGKCIKDVLDSNMPDDGPDDEPDSDPDDQAPPVTVVTLDARAQRLKEAAEFRASLKI